MCKAEYRQNLVCQCVYVYPKVALCPLFKSIPENKGRTEFNAKLITPHCQGLNLFFDTVDYVSVDVEHDIVPNGIDCPDLESFDSGMKAVDNKCELCDQQGALKYLKVKGIKFTSIQEKTASRLREEAAERDAEDAKGKGKSVERSAGDSARRPSDLSDVDAGIKDKLFRAFQMLGTGGKILEGKKAGSGAAESPPGSMGWD